MILVPCALMPKLLRAIRLILSHQIRFNKMLKSQKLINRRAWQCLAELVLSAWIKRSTLFVSLVDTCVFATDAVLTFSRKISFVPYVGKRLSRLSRLIRHEKQLLLFI